MKINFVIFFIFIFFLPYLVRAQDNFLNTYDHKKLEGQTLKVYSETGLVSLTALKPNIIKVSFLKSDALNNKDLIKGEEVFVRVTQNLDDIFMQTDSLLIIISKIDFSIKFEKSNEEIYVINDFSMEKNSKRYFQFAVPKPLEMRIKINKRKITSDSLGFGVFFKGLKKTCFINPNNGMIDVSLSVKKLDYLFVAGNSDSLKNASKYFFKN
ncbi:MAG: hypothetical protein ABIP95_01440 [Pelobium sp.]